MVERKRRTKVQAKIQQSYVFRIDQILPSYSFSVGHVQHNDGDFTDYNHTDLETTCLVPPKYAGQLTKFVLLGDRRLIERMHNRSPSNDYIPSVGTLKMRKDQSEYLGSIPSDAAFTIPVLALVHGLKYIYLAGQPTHGGTVKINFISFSNDFDPDDY